MTFNQYKSKILRHKNADKINFDIDGRMHYVYRITDGNLHYYGSKTENFGINNPTLGISYFSSSKDSDFKIKLMKEKEKYRFKIVRYFNNPGDKILYECYLHQKFNVKNNNKFINRSNQTPFGFDTTGKPACNHKEIYQLDRNGKIIKRWYSIEEASKALDIQGSCISATCRNINKTSGSYAWCFVEDYEKARVLAFKNNDTRGIKQQVLKLNTNGDIIKEYESLQSAAIDNGFKNSSPIQICCKNQKRTSKKHVWCYKKDYTSKMKNFISSWDYNKGGKNAYQSKQVLQLDPDSLKIISCFESALAAANFHNLRCPNGILKACRSNKFTAAGYKWKFKN